MRLKLYTEFNDGKIKIKPSINEKFEKIDFAKTFELENTCLYEGSDKEKIDFERLYKRIKILRDEVYRDFKIKLIPRTTFIMSACNVDNSTPIYEFIKNNKDLNVLLGVENLKEAIDNLGTEDYPNLSISFEQSEEHISYKEFLNMYIELDKIVKFVEHYNLSPLEKVTLVYDIVKSNRYNEEGLDEAYGSSRDLHRIINNDKIVCLGFANLIDFLLNNLGITSKKVKLFYDKKRTGHARNYVILKDEKYNIDGAFFLDATWDCKKSDEYINNYLFFLRPFKFFKCIKKDEKIRSPRKFEAFEIDPDNLISSLENMEYIKKLSMQASLIQLVLEINKKEINCSGIFGSKCTITRKQIDGILKYYNQKIDREAFKCAIYKVRKIEYINGIISEMPTNKELNDLCDRYALGILPETWNTLINGRKHPNINKVLKETKSASIKEDVLKARLIRDLKEINDDRPKIKYISKM